MSVNQWIQHVKTCRVEVLQENWWFWGRWQTLHFNVFAYKLGFKGSCIVFLNLPVLVTTTRILMVFKQKKSEKPWFFRVRIFSNLKFEETIVSEAESQIFSSNECFFFWSWTKKKVKTVIFVKFSALNSTHFEPFSVFYSKFISTRIFGVMSISKTNFRVCNSVKKRRLIFKWLMAYGGLWLLVFWLMAESQN